MRLVTDKVRLQIDLALAVVEENPTPAVLARRQLLVPVAPGTERSRPTLVAPERERSTRLDFRAPLGS